MAGREHLVNGVEIVQIRWSSFPMFKLLSFDDLSSEEVILMTESSLIKRSLVASSTHNTAASSPDIEMLEQQELINKDCFNASLNILSFYMVLFDLFIDINFLAPNNSFLQLISYVFLFPDLKLFLKYDVCIIESMRSRNE